MATDFAPYANLRMLWSQPGTVTSLREGLPAPADLVVLEAFMKGDGATPQELPSLRVGTTVLQGYLTRYATLPAGGDWLGSGASITAPPNRLTYSYSNNTYDPLSRFVITEVTNPNWIQRVDGTIDVYINNVALSPDQYSIEENITLDIVEIVLATSVTSTSYLNYGVEWQWDQVATVPAWTWDDSGLMPAGLAAETRGRAFYGDLASLPTRANGGILGEATILQLGGQFGIGGIGAELRTALGDAIRVSFATVQ